ncbi:hypothetical protein [[Eubacterium] hominis]|uniref:hypothetical protein n=1 Tax=[Eubacterium] hominis TaxID=2764325 RepID=UPI003A4DCE8F
METIITLLIIIGIIAILIAIAPVILTFVGIFLLAAVIYILYTRHKFNKYREHEEQGYYEDSRSYTNTSNRSSMDDDIIDVEYTETTESDDAHD